jgi:hypothetical protein
MRTVRISNDDIVDYFDTPQEFGFAFRNRMKVRGDDVELSTFGMSEWTGSNRHSSLKAMESGVTDGISEAEGLMRKVEVEIDVAKPEWAPSVAGAFPVIPDYLSGHPQSMRRKVYPDTHTSPMRLFIDLTSSGGIDHQTLRKRGIAFLALAMTLVRIRPVEMWAVIALGGRNNGIAAVRVNTAPLDTAVACGIFTDAGVARDIGYTWLDDVRQTRGHWYHRVYPDAGVHCDDQRSRYNSTIRRSLGCQPDDVFIGPMHLHDQLVTDPVAFIKRAIKERSEVRQ